MIPEEFGPFLSEQRKKKNLTQSQLAEMLHVTTAAVSKWERCKCLPDVSKLEALCRVLDLSLMEIMQCRESKESCSPEIVENVLMETIEMTSNEHRKKTAKWITAVAIIAAIVICCYFFPIYHIAAVWEPSYFTTGEISKLAYIGSAEDRKTAQRLLAQAEKAFSDYETKDDDLEEKYGLLARYATPAERGGADEKHSLKLWSAHFELCYGYVWVYYSQEIYDSDGKRVWGSWKIPSLWTYQWDEESDQWNLIHIKEHP